MDQSSFGHDLCISCIQYSDRILFPQGTIRRAMKLISNYWLGVLMYLALTILIVDLIRLILIYFVKADQEVSDTKSFRIVGSICMIFDRINQFYGGVMQGISGQQATTQRYIKKQKIIKS